MDYLKANYSDSGVTASTIEQIDKNQYVKLQELVGRDIVRSFGGNVIPVQYDDIMWSKLKRNRPEFQQFTAADGLQPPLTSTVGRKN